MLNTLKIYTKNSYYEKLYKTNLKKYIIFKTAVFFSVAYAINKKNYKPSSYNNFGKIISKKMIKNVQLIFVINQPLFFCNYFFVFK